MPGISGPDKIIIGDIQLGPQAAEQPADVVNIFLGGLPVLFGGLDNLVSVLVRARQKKGLFPGQTMEPALGIGHNGGISMPQVGLGVNVIDGR
jgi:hypothetical protein